MNAHILLYTAVLLHTAMWSHPCVGVFADNAASPRDVWEFVTIIKDKLILATLDINKIEDEIFLDIHHRTMLRYLTMLKEDIGKVRVQLQQFSAIWKDDGDFMAVFEYLETVDNYVIATFEYLNEVETVIEEPDYTEYGFIGILPYIPSSFAVPNDASDIRRHGLTSLFVCAYYVISLVVLC